MRQMFSKKQIEELAREIAKEVVDNTPKGFDIDEITIGEDLSQGAVVEDDKLPLDTIENATEGEITTCISLIKKFVKRGYLDHNGARLILVCFEPTEYWTIIFGMAGQLTGYMYELYIDEENIHVSYTEL